MKNVNIRLLEPRSIKGEMCENADDESKKILSCMQNYRGNSGNTKKEFGVRGLCREAVM